MLSSGSRSLDVLRVRVRDSWGDNIIFSFLQAYNRFVMVVVISYYDFVSSVSTFLIWNGMKPLKKTG